MSVHAAPVALDEVVAAAVLGVPEAHDTVLVDVPEDLRLVLADRGLLERVLVNLLDNAVQHGASSSPIEIRAYVLSQSAKIEIIDHGPGVSAEQRERLFIPFQRLDDRSTATGVGLDLSVARGFAEAMGGALVADDYRGRGLTMCLRLRLPLATAPPDVRAQSADAP